MRNGTIVFVVAACTLVVGGGCASSPEPLSKLIYARAPSSPDKLLPGPQLWGLAFDAREADFDDWVDDFEQKVHHNWVLSTYFGYGGRVQLGFVVEENGTVTAIEVLESTATQPLVDAAREAGGAAAFGHHPQRQAGATRDKGFGPGRRAARRVANPDGCEGG